jgi:hypothetical protein
VAIKPKDPEPKRLNRAVKVTEALTNVLDAALRKRGFASRDLIGKWAAIAPKPYDVVALPDRLAWPRGARGAEGATLYLRCLPGHALALSHEGALIAAAVNRYFGYVLVKDVRMSLEPMPAPVAAVKPVEPKIVPPEIEARTAAVGDPAVRDALRELGRALRGKPVGKRG